MDYFEILNISERYMELINPSTPEKIVRIGEIMGLNSNSRVIDFGCGFGEVLALWAKHLGISGVGIDIRDYAVERAKEKMDERGLSDRIRIIKADGAKYQFEEVDYDAAICIGASFIWGGYKETIRAMKKAVHKKGKLVIGEPYWNKDQIPAEFTKREKTVNTESEILQITREEGFDIGYLARASDDDWDRYESDNWIALINWLKENQGNESRDEVMRHLHRHQDEYFKYGRAYLGWAVFVLTWANY